MKKPESLAGVHTQTHTLCLLNKIKEEKASITLFTLIACLFFIIVLLLVNIGMINKETNQEKELEQIAKNHNISETDLENNYKKVADENEYITRGELNQAIESITAILGVGGIEESGPSYIRFKEGTQIEWGNVILPANTSTNLRTAEVTIAKSFKDTEYKVICSGSRNANTLIKYYEADTAGNTKRTNSTFQISGITDSTNNYTITMQYIAIGKWK